MQKTFIFFIFSRFDFIGLTQHMRVPEDRFICVCLFTCNGYFSERDIAFPQKNPNTPLLS